MRLFAHTKPAQCFSGSEGAQIPQEPKTWPPWFSARNALVVAALLLILFGTLIIKAASVWAQGQREGPLITRGQVYIVGQQQDLIVIQGRPHSLALPIRGHSMEPAWYAGQTAVVVPVPVSEIKMGDDIAYWTCGIKIQRGSLLGHRVVTIGTDSEGWYAFTKGLQNSARDECIVRPENIVGVMAVQVK